MAGIGFDELAFGEVGSFGGILHQCVLVLEYLEIAVSPLRWFQS